MDSSAERRRDSRVGAAYAGIAVGALAVVGAAAVGWRRAARPLTVRSLTLGPLEWVSVRPTAATGRAQPRRRPRR